MTVAADPIGIDETTRAAAVPRQMYDLDGLLAGFSTSSLSDEMVDYAGRRFVREAAYWQVPVVHGEPWDGIRTRLDAWKDCIDATSEHWRLIRGVQQSQLRRAVHKTAWGWRARSSRIAFAAECLRRGAGGWSLWVEAVELAALVPETKSKSFKNALAELTGGDARDMPLERHHVVWDAFVPGPGDDVDALLDRARSLLRASASA